MQRHGDLNSPGSRTAAIETMLPPEIRPLLARVAQLVAERGWGSYLVGGFVRDALLGHPQKDVDVSIVGDGVALAEQLAAETGSSTESTGRFGTAAVAVGAGLDLDFVTARSETYPHPGALPVVEPGDIQQDLARRDFTVNALAVPILPSGLGDIVDPHGGLADLDARLIRVLHPRSFIDDPTRIFRAFKLAERLGFKIERGTLELVLQAVRDGALATISTERAVRELLLALEEPRADAILARLEQLGVLAAMHPGLSWRYEPGKMRAAEGITPAERRNAYLAILAAEYARDPSDAEALARWLRLPAPLVSLMRDSAQLAQLWPRLSGDELSPSQVYRLLHPLDAGALEAYAHIEPLSADTVAWERLQQYLRQSRYVKPQTRGDFLLGLGVQRGPVYREAMEALHNAVLDGEVSTREGEEAYLRRWLRGRGLDLGEGNQ